MILPFVFPFPLEIAYTTHFVAQLSNVVINTSGICILTSVVVVFANFIEHLVSGKKNTVLALCSIYLFFAALILFALLAAAGAIKRKPLLLMISFFVWMIDFIYWLGLCSVLYTSWHTVGDLCVNDRCPENFWMSDFYNRSREELVFENTKNITVNPTQAPYLNASHRFITVKGPEYGSKPEVKKNKLPLFLSLVIFFSFLFFFTMLGSMVLNYYNTLIYLQDLNITDQHVVFPHAALIFVYPIRSLLEPSNTSDAARNEQERKPESAKNKKPVKSAQSETAQKLGLQ